MHKTTTSGTRYLITALLYRNLLDDPSMVVIVDYDNNILYEYFFLMSPYYWHLFRCIWYLANEMRMENREIIMMMMWVPGMVPGTTTIPAGTTGTRTYIYSVQQDCNKSFASREYNNKRGHFRWHT